MVNIPDAGAEEARERRPRLDDVLAEIWRQHELPASPEERSRLANHDDLYGDDGLPR